MKSHLVEMLNKAIIIIIIIIIIISFIIFIIGVSIRVQTWKMNKGDNKTIDEFQIPNYEESSLLKSKVMSIRRASRKSWHGTTCQIIIKRRRWKMTGHILRSDHRNLCNIPHTKLSLRHFGGHSRFTPNTVDSHIAKGSFWLGAKARKGACTVVSRFFQRSVGIVVWPVRRWFVHLYIVN